MIIRKKHRAIVLNLKHPDRITTVIPTARQFKYKGRILVAVPHRTDEVKVLRNLGFDAPPPISSYYDWPGAFTPFAHQVVTSEFLTMHNRAFCLNDMGCVDSETEYLGPTGWKKISEYTGGKVTQFNPDTLVQELVEPTEYVKLECPTMVRFRSPYTDQLLSLEHRVLLYRDGHGFYVAPAAEVALRCSLGEEGCAEQECESLGGDLLYTGSEFVPFFPGGSSVALEPSTDGFKYCFMVPSTFLVLRRNGCVFCTGNTGKTLSVLWAYDYLRREKMAHKLLVVTPLSTLERTWGDEIFKNFPHLTFAVLHGSRSHREKLLEEDVDVYLINHDGAKILSKQLGAREDIDLVVVDEIAQAARNASTDRWKALRTIIKDKPRVWGLTGTPTPNEPTDAWAQCRLICPENVPPYYGKFRESVMKQISNFKWVARPNATDIVHDAMQPAIRYKRDECIDLPECMYETRSVVMTPDQNRMYKEMLSRLHAEIDGNQVTAVNEAVKAMKLVQIATGCAYGNDGQIVSVPAHSRLAVTLEIIEEAPAKVIVFVPFTAALHAVAEYLSKHVSVEIIAGSVSKSERDRILGAFQNTSEPRVLVAQPAAMSHGLTLTAANTIIWFAPINSNETYEQANARITRPGQKIKQLVVHIEGSPVEQNMYKRLQGKGTMQGILLETFKEKV